MDQWLSEHVWVLVIAEGPAGAEELAGVEDIAGAVAIASVGINIWTIIILELLCVSPTKKGQHSQEGYLHMYPTV